MSRRAFVTLHDVTPHTLDDCLETLRTLGSLGVDPVTLLVVSGTGWAEQGLDTLRQLAADGCRLAAHGWSHAAPPPATVHHRAHRLLISRDEAEHLSRSGPELRGLVARCARWFDHVGLGTPSLYVPPAWALGRLSSADLSALPFRYYETLTGIRDTEARRFRALPLVGYLADTRARAWALRGLNALNRAAAAALRRPLRVSVHPPDLRLHLADDLLRLLDRDWQYVSVETALGPAEHGVAGRVS